MKQFLIFVMVLGLLVLPVSAVPYTETELEEYMQALYCEPVWVAEYPQFRIQFIFGEQITIITSMVGSVT